jgi:hypothetical protein
VLRFLVGGIANLAWSNDVGFAPESGHSSARLGILKGLSICFRIVGHVGQSWI